MSGALDGYKPNSQVQTIWATTPKQVCVVESTEPPPPEIHLRESLGRIRFKTAEMQGAADMYRQLKKLPANWPVRVELVDSATQEVQQTAIFGAADEGELKEESPSDAD